MDKIRKVMIVGLGALGTYYADAFSKAEDCEVYVLTEADRKARYEQTPRILNGEEKRFHYVEPEEDSEPMDFILVCTKSDAMRKSLEMMVDYVGPETIIASLMNGVVFEDLAASKFGMEHVVYMIYLGDGIKNMDGRIETAGRNMLYFGSLGHDHDDKQVALLEELCQRAGAGYEIPADMLYAYWRKFLIIVSYNQASTLLGLDYAVFHNAPDAVGLADDLLKEGIPVAAAAGVNGADRLYEDVRQAAMGLSQDCVPSMLQDRMMGRRMEVDIFSDEILSRSRELGLSAPTHAFTSRVFHAINQRNGF